MRDLRVAHYVGRYFQAYDSRCDVNRLWLCVGYDPNVDYFCATVDDLGPQRMVDISVRAIGRTFHETHDRDFPVPELLVFVVEAAKRSDPSWRDDPRVMALDEPARAMLSKVYDGAHTSLKKWGRLG